MNTVHWCNDTDRGKPNTEENLSQRHCIRHKSHMGWSELNQAYAVTG
jgi:hypothetical protein